MLKYYLQKFFFQIILAVAAVLLFGVFIYAQAIQGAYVVPTDVREQFKDSLGRAGTVTSAKVGEVDISVRHMSSQEIVSLLEIMVSETLSFNPSNYDRNTDLVKSYFTPTGYRQYQQYLATAKLGETIKSRYWQSGVFSERPPLEINAQEQNGAFKWLYEVPVTISFVPASSETNRGGTAQSHRQSFTLRLQLTRVKDTQNPNKIAIEIWQMQAPRG